MATEYAENIPSNLISQYQESTTFIAFLQALASEADVLGNNSNEVILRRTLQVAQGVQLDVIGLLVGASRQVAEAIIIEFFGYDPDPTALSFSDLENPNLGGRYRSTDEDTQSTRLLGDTDYRLYISGAILRNKTRCTGDEVLEATKNLFALIDGIEPIVKVIDGDMYFSVNVGRDLSPNDKLLVQSLNLLIKPIGVRAFYVSYLPAYTGLPNAAEGYFGFKEDPNARGYGSVKDNDFTLWAPVNGGTVTPNTDVAPDGTTTADTLHDTSNTLFQAITKDLTTLWDTDRTLPITVTCRIKKDSVEKITRYILIDLFFGPDGQALKLDTSTGEINLDEVAGNPIILDAGVRSRNDYWQIYIVGLAANLAATACFVEIYPAAGYYVDPDWTNDVAITGTCVAWGFEAYNSYGQRQLNNDFASLEQFEPPTITTPDTDIAPDGTQTADTITDNNITEWEYVTEDATAKFVDKNVPMVAAVRIKKDDIPKTTRFILLRILFFGGAGIRFSDLTLDTSTGEILGTERFPEAPVYDFGKYDLGTYWLIYLVVGSTLVGNNNCDISIFPSAGHGNSLSLGNYDATTTGSIVVWGLETYQGWFYSTYPGGRRFYNILTDFSQIEQQGNDVVESNVDIGPDGTQTADRLTDTRTNLTEGLVNFDITAQWADKNEPVVVALRVKKDSVPKTDRFFIYRLVFTGVTYDSSYMLIDTKTGEFNATSDIDGSSQAEIIDAGVYTDGDYWVFYLVAKNGWPTNSTCQIDIFPAAGAYSNGNWEFSNAVVGSAVVWGLQWYQGSEFILGQNVERFNDGGEWPTLFEE